MLATMFLLFGASGCASLVTDDREVVQVVSPEDEAKQSSAFKHGVAALQLGKYEKAQAHFEKALLKFPSSGASFNNLGLACYHLRALPDAYRNFEAAVGLLPEDPKPLNNLGMTLEAGGRVIDALEYYRNASGLEPDNALYLGNLVRAKIRLGEQGPEIVMLLEDLVFIENRPEWISWADEQLAIFNNPVLDRGPSPSIDNPSDQVSEQIYPKADEAELVPLSSIPAESHISDSALELPIPLAIPE